ncbi:MAG: UvrD-helicase domain-containing protein [Chloroflexi bacterium]|nr:UvrD-helicase domain-containing protein [Chloroflexota bacterium]
MPPILEGLNEPQRAAVQHGEGPVLILAGPGSGKTRVITHRIAHLVRERHVPPWRILAVTFTNKAAREMRERASRLLGEDSSSVALGTFHSMCARWLRVDGGLIGVDPNFVIYDDSDQVALMKRVLEDLNVDVRRFAPRSVLSAISAAKSELIDHEGYAGRVNDYFQEVVARAFTRYTQALHAASALDFDDLLNEAVRLFRDSEPARDKYAGRFLHVLVDEFQDTNPAQYQLAKLLASKHRNIAVVGDPDQSIYSWRAADVRNMQYFEADFPGCTTYLLEQNYRSTRPILAAADAVIRKNPNRKERMLWTERPGGDLIVTYEAYSDEEEGEFVASEVRRLMATGKGAGEFAVMYRTNAQSRTVEEAMVRHRIPYRLIGGVRFYQRREIKDLIAYLRLIHNRNDEASLLRIINVPGRGIGGKTIDRLRTYASAYGMSLWDACELGVRGKQPVDGITGRSAAAVFGFVHALDRLRAMRDARKPLADIFDALLGHTDYLKYLRDGDDAQERLENVEQLRALISQYEEVGGEENDLATFLQDVALVADVDDLQEGAKAVTLITLHAAKGLEFPVVFMTGLEEGVLPHIRSFDDPRQMEEERRLAYVGITRAEDLLYLTRAYRRYAMGGQSTNPESRFLRDIPGDLTRSWGSTTKMTYAETVAAAPMREEFRPEEAEFEAGASVRHAKFGAGKVVSVQKNGGDVEYQVAFESAGIRRLLQSYAKLVPA